MGQVKEKKTEMRKMKKKGMEKKGWLTFTKSLPHIL